MSNRGAEAGRVPLMPIGELARQTGKRPSLIRYYEQIGLLPRPVRVSGSAGMTQAPCAPWR